MHTATRLAIAHTPMSIYNPNGGCPNEPIEVRPMRHQGYIKRQKEDRAGVTDQKKRKKLQNRLNQRARKRLFHYKT